MKKKRKIINIYEVKVLLLTCGESSNYPPIKVVTAKRRAWLNDGRKANFSKNIQTSPAPFSHNIFKSQQSKKSEWNMYIYQNFPQQKKTAGLTTLLCVVALFFWSAHKVFANSVLLCLYKHLGYDTVFVRFPTFRCSSYFLGQHKILLQIYFNRNRL